MDIITTTPTALGLYVNSDHINNNTNTNGIKVNNQGVRHILNANFESYSGLIPNIAITLDHADMFPNPFLVTATEAFNYKKDIRKQCNVHTTTNVVFNFTNNAIFVKDRSNFPIRIDPVKKLVNIENTDLEKFNGYIDILTIYSVYSPLIATDGLMAHPEDNYIEELFNIFNCKDNPESTNKEALEILRFVRNNFMELENIIPTNVTNKIPLNFYIKAAVINRVIATSLDDSRDESIYIENKDLVISKKNPVHMPRHPAGEKNTYLRNSEVDLKNGTMAVYIIDRKSKLSKTKFIKILDKVYKVEIHRKSPSNNEKVDGFYFEQYVDGVIVPFYKPLEEIETLSYIYDSEEEALNGTNTDKLLERDIARYKVDLQKQLEINALNNSAHEKELAQVKLELARSEAERDRIKILHEQDKYAIENDLMFKKHAFDNVKYKRETIGEGIKTVALIISAATAAALYISKNK